MKEKESEEIKNNRVEPFKMEGSRGLWAPRSVCIVLYFYLCLTLQLSEV